MVKKLQTLRVKKGFTLVELIVVIAIIGVLAAILIPTLASQITKAKVVSADSTAKELITTVNTWIASTVQAGGNEFVAEDVVITMNGGTASVTGGSVTSTRDGDSSANLNNWTAEGIRGAESLASRFETDYSARTFTAKVFVDSSGYAVYAWVVPDKGDYSGEAPDGGDFEAGGFVWKSDKKEGVTKGGAVVGTSPKLHMTET